MGLHITYDRMVGHYIFHNRDGGVQFNKYEIDLPYIYAKKHDVASIYKVQDNLEGFTKK